MQPLRYSLYWILYAPNGFGDRGETGTGLREYMLTTVTWRMSRRGRVLGPCPSQRTKIMVMMVPSKGAKRWARDFT